MSARQNPLIGSVGVFAIGRVQSLFLKKDIEVVERRGRKLGDLLYRLDRKHRERTIANLAMAFPDWSTNKVEKTSREVFRHWGLVAADFFRTPLRSDEELLANMEVDGYERYAAAADKHKGVIAMTAHFGNFERFGHWCTATGRPITVVAREANQGQIQERIAGIRARTKVEFLSRGDTMRSILRKLKADELIGLLPDQNSKESFLPFFGHPAGTVLGPAKLHQKTGAGLVPAFCVRVGPGKYKVFVQEAIDLEGIETDTEAIMAKFNLALEKVVREYPEQYLWMHDRWKSARQAGLL